MVVSVPVSCCRPALMAVALWAAVLPACSDRPDPEGLDDQVGAAALALCQPIRAWVNELAGLANRTTDEVGALTDPAARSQRVLAGYDELVAATGRYRRSLDGLTVAGTDEGERAAGDLRDGADRALAVLGDERAEFARETGGTVSDDDLFGRMGQFMISLETVTGAAEPPVVSYDDVGFQQAVLDEPACDHVVQPFTIEP